MSKRTVLRSAAAIMSITFGLLTVIHMVLGQEPSTAIIFRNDPSAAADGQTTSDVVHRNDSTAAAAAAATTTTTLLSRLEQPDCESMFRCPPPMTTKSKVMPDWDKLDCRCDDDCLRYGDCCANWAGFHPEQARLARRHFKCVNFVAYRGIFLLSTCPANWTDDAVREQCESATRGTGDTIVGHTADPLSATPVTSLSSRFTYPNLQCAACNSDLNRVVYWTPRVECDTLHAYNATYGNITSDYVWRNLRYDAADRVWGVRLPNVVAGGGGGAIDFGPFVRDPTFVPCRVVVQMPVDVVDTVRQCHPSIDECPSGWTGNDTVRTLCESYTAVVFSNVGDMPIFRNVHCAVCHDESTQDLDCRSFPMYRNVVPSSFAPSFAFLFDINERGGAVVGAVDRCPAGHIYDPFFRRCRRMVCAGPRHRLSQGRCLDVDETATTMSTTPAIPENVSVATGSTSSNTNVSTELPDTTASTSIAAVTDKGGDDCPRFNLSSSDYQMYGNGTVYIARYHRHYAPGEYVSSLEGHILICSPLADDASLTYRRKFSLTMAYLTVAGLGISLVCLFFHMVAFLLVPCLRNLSGKNLASLCVVLCVAYVTFIVSQFKGAAGDGGISRRSCATIATLLYYCFLATFFWMNSIAFDVWRTLRLATSELRVSAGQQWRKFAVYSAYSWLSPAALVAAALFADASPAVSDVYRPGFGHVTCWFGSRRALLVFFVAPISMLLALNVALFVSSARIIIRSTRSTSGKLHPGGQQQARRNFTLYLRLALIMGLTWLLGVAAGQLDDFEPLWYAFVVLNTLQGLFIFLSFTCTEKVRNYLRDKVFCRATSYYGSSTQVTNTRSNNGTRKFELEGRDSAGSGSGESQSSSASRSSLIKLNSRASNVY